MDQFSSGSVLESRSALHLIPQSKQFPMFPNRFFPSATSPPTPGLPNNPLKYSLGWDLWHSGTSNVPAYLRSFLSLQRQPPTQYTADSLAFSSLIQCSKLSLFRAFGHSVSPLWRIPTQSRIKLNLCLVNSTNSLTSQWGKYHCPGFRRQKPKVAQQLANWSGRQHGAVGIWILFSLIPSFLFL